MKTIQKIQKKGVFVLFGVFLMAAMSSCHSEDPSYDDVVPPTVTYVHNISGSVAAMDGKGITNATVTMSGTASGTVSTDANGYFVFQNVKPGSYQLEVSAPGKISKSTTVTVVNANAQNVVWNVMLANEASVTNISVAPNTKAEEDVTSETLAGNTLAEVEVEVEVPANSVNKAAVITLEPIYEESEAAMRATTSVTESTMLIGSKLSCSDKTVVIESPIRLTFNLDNETANAITTKKYVNGNWVKIPCEVEGGNVIVEADEFTSYGIFLDVKFTSTSRNEAVKFAQDLWDNLNGNREMNVGTATYDYRVGIQIDNTKGSTVLGALLIEVLAREYGANAYDAQGSYPLNMKLPVGTALKLNGTQTISAVSTAALGKSATGTQYGNVTITANTYNRNHTGGNGGNH